MARRDDVVGGVLTHTLLHSGPSDIRLRIICLLTPSITHSHTTPPRAHTLPIQRVIIHSMLGCASSWDLVRPSVVGSGCLLCHLQHPRPGMQTDGQAGETLGFAMPWK